MKRVVLVIHVLSGGGAERVMATMANHWAGEGREVTLLTLDDGSNPPFYSLDERVKHRCLGIAGVSNGLWSSIVNNVYRIGCLRSALKSSAPDAVISFMSSVNVLVLFAAIGLRIPVIVSERVDPRFHPVGLLWDLLRRVAYLWASRVVFQSPAAMDCFSQLIRKRGVVIPNPVSKVPEDGLDQDHAPASGDMVCRTILAMGRLEQQKGFDRLIKAFSRLADRYPEWQLEIFGEGTLRAQLYAEICKEGLQERAFLRGMTRDPMAEFRRSDLFVLSSRYEGFPNALCEAMAAGLAVIAFDCPSGPGEIVRDGIDGVLVPNGDLPALERAMESLMASEPDRRRLARRAPEVATRFAIDRVMGQWLSLVDDVTFKGVKTSMDQPDSVYSEVDSVGDGRPGMMSAAILSTTMQNENTAINRDRSDDATAPRCKVLFVIRALAYGGAERQLIELVRAIDKDQFRVTVVTFYDAGKLGDEVRAIAGIRVVSLHKKGRWDLVPFLARFVTLVREFKPDVVHGYMGTSNELALLAWMVCRARVVWGIRGSQCNHAAYNDWVRRFTHWSERKFSRFADCIIVNSEAGRTDYIRDGYDGSRMKVICNGIDTARFSPDPEAGLEVRREWGAPAGVPIIGLIARLDPMKGHSTFLRAAALLAARRPDVWFVCVGDGPQAYCKRLVSLGEELGLQSRLMWHPARRDVGAVYNALTILTSSSTFGEGFSNVIGEAMACGTPVVATDVGDAALILDDPTVVVPPGCPEKLVEAWETILDQPPEALACRAREGRERVIREYSLSLLASRTEAALLETLQWQK